MEKPHKQFNEIHNYKETNYTKYYTRGSFVIRNKLLIDNIITFGEDVIQPVFKGL